MNLSLVPHTWHRHLAMAYWCAGVGLLAWWAVLTSIVRSGSDPIWHGPVLLASIASAVAAASVFGEGSLRRTAIGKRLVLTVVAALLTGSVTFACAWLTARGDDSSLVSVRSHFPSFVLAGIATATGPLAVRRLEGALTHLLAGVSSGLFAALVWYLCGTLWHDLYIAGAALALAWGFAWGPLAWQIPDRLYTGWIRVLAPTRFGHRIPIDARDGSPKERFVGHYPRGLDLWLPAESGVSEMHASIAVDADQGYRARGLTLEPVRVRRFLESVDLRYDPDRATPLEADLHSGDRIEIGGVEIEFLLLPREDG